MDKDSDREMQEMMDEFAEDLEKTTEKDNGLQRRKSVSAFPVQERSLLWCSIGIAFLLAIFALFTGDGNDALTKEIRSLTSGFDHMEERLSLLEKRLEQDVDLENQVKGLNQSLSKLDRSGKSLKGHMDKLDQEIDRLEKELASTRKTIKEQMEVPGIQTSQDKKRHHIVRPGDTLFRISQKYAVPIPELRRLNNLKGDQAIYPGQELLLPTAVP